jgi:hypothetical protein
MGLKKIGWQGITLEVPEGWEVTGFSGDYREGYLRIDDGESRSCELKWGSWGKRERGEPDIELRAESYLASLERAAKKRKQSLSGKLAPAPKGTQRSERLVAGFTFVGERKAVGAAIYCRESRRVLLAQVQGASAKEAERILASVEVKDEQPGWRLWALYDLRCDVPSDFALVGQQVMNVYVMLTFARAAERMTIEQWSIADVARKDSYLDVWMKMNAKGELAMMTTEVEEARVGGHDAIAFVGRPEIGLPLFQLVREAARQWKWPALRFTAHAWECEESNKLYLIQHTRGKKSMDLAGEVAQRTLCHGEAAR